MPEVGLKVDSQVFIVQSMLSTRDFMLF